MERNLEWFKSEIAPTLKGYVLTYKYFKEGDFGSLNQIELSSPNVGGNIDFWGLNWFGIFLWDYNRQIELMNILLEPNEVLEKEKALANLLNILSSPSSP